MEVQKKSTTNFVTKKSTVSSKASSNKCLMDQNLQFLLKIKVENPESSAETVETINNLIRHVRNNCPKCPKDSVYLIVGAFYFELFEMRLNKFKNTIIYKELANLTNLECNDCEKENKWDDIKIKNCNTFSEIINLDGQKKVLEYLFKTIDVWKKLLDVKERLNPELIQQLDVYEILRNCYFIFTFYGVTKYIKSTCTIFLDLVLLHGQSFKNHLLFAYYCQIRFCLDYGLLIKAKNYLKTSNSIIKNYPQKNQKYILLENYLIRIADCELRLLLDEKVEKAILDLKELINAEFFKPVTVATGYIKSMAHFLLTKFSAKLFPDQNLNHYLNEPLIFTKSLFNKWYPILSESGDKRNKQQINVNSPIWLEFAVTKFVLEFSLTYYYYSINCSTVDVHFSFNILVTKLARIYCSLLWLSRILLLSIYYEKTEVQKAKINQVKNLFARKKVDETYVLIKPSREIKQFKQNQIVNTTQENESVILLQDDSSLDIRSKEYANCSHQEDTPIYLLKKLMLKNSVMNEEEIEVPLNYDYEKELENLDDYFIPDLIIVKQELLLLLYLINEGKPSFIKYFKQLDLDILNTIYFENLSGALNVDFERLNRNHQNLIASSFNMCCIIIYIENIALDNSSILDLTKNVLKKASKLGQSYEIRCFICEIVIYYVQSLFKESCSNKTQLNILEYDFLECEKYFTKALTDCPKSPVRQQRSNLRSSIKVNAPKKVRNYKMDEIKDYIQEMYDLNFPKNSVKLNFTESDEEEEANKERDKKNLRLKIKKLKEVRKEAAKLTATNTNLKSSQQATRTLKELKTNIDLNTIDLNNLNNRIGSLCLDDSFNDDENYEFLINESSDNYLNEFRKLLLNVLDLFGCYPPIRHYNTINKLLFQLSIRKESEFAQEAAYYFSEICQANALRYKTIQHLQKKQKYMTIKNDSKVLTFKNQIESRVNELNKMFDILPSSWRVLQIQFLKDTNSQSDLYLARYQRNTNPIILKINFNSQKEFNEIIQLSTDTAKEKDSKSFWRLRYALDERLKRLLKDVNSAWINCFIGLFLGECLNSNYKIISKKIEEKILNFAKDNKLICKNEGLLKVICESFIYLKEESFNHAMACLFEPKNIFEDLYDHCLEVVKKYVKFNTQEELKESFSNKLKFAPVGLITGSTLENFPFESLFYLRMIKQEMFRIPSVRFLNWMYVNLRKNNQRVKQGVSDKDVYYLLNPSNNLSHTENLFKIKFESLKNTANWDGLIGEIPSQIELQKALEKKDIYIYFGHNSGLRYIGKLHQCNVNCLSLVIGCSSAALTNQDRMVESFGSSYYFLINGCPTYLGCLWNVTDRDIDRFAERLLKHTFKIYDLDENDKNIEKCNSVTKAVALSRDVCKLKYLNGSAPVIRGLPISMKD